MQRLIFTGLLELMSSTGAHKGVFIICDCVCVCMCVVVSGCTSEGPATCNLLPSLALA